MPGARRSGETPVPTLTLPAGSFPEWSGTTIYSNGQRVPFDTGAFEAKWWTQGDSPDAAAENPDASPGWRSSTPSCGCCSACLRSRRTPTASGSRGDRDGPADGTRWLTRPPECQPERPMASDTSPMMPKKAAPPPMKIASGR
ncbi:hypothetical protein E3O55_18780 [Cryobacterium sp. MDB1-18-2]|uniref:Chitin-binding type-3 domain-containing protein n=1 Tax=Cryobacterium glucosi TaxID=1259175 RepID=A0ABY2ILG4_9MICO|nr:hypothetical protein E3O39_00370 [Cryobacterium sp. MDB2-A-1]TFC08828.1 hypothetical protein E3O59_06820 [Cryobacterium sp. MDB2-33-2]TFC09169.1 hypothetical protein E3O35_15680 [Cryobacterium sp. MDB2-A-2]TFC18024.1 hypothetical protein E3O46_15055 [Cryobacterium glucosi]TFC22880.1 hypothetical protein E3O55_18780 [Cryobacterium sp. MDB1-18-2]TFC22948.1 hypothetical protein E3O51_01650 [Cryobacterium sp. MDB2-10]TFC42736.1 hypothetical protein E3O50_08215 [Cryobacterium sp. MDB1-18-1]